MGRSVASDSPTGLALVVRSGLLGADGTQRSLCCSPKVPPSRASNHTWFTCSFDQRNRGRSEADAPMPVRAMDQGVVLRAECVGPSRLFRPGKESRLPPSTASLFDRGRMP